MMNVIILTGLAIVLYTLLAVALGLPRPADFLPIEWFGEVPEGNYYKIVASSSRDYSTLYTIGLGLAIAGLGFLLSKFKARRSGKGKIA